MHRDVIPIPTEIPVGDDDQFYDKAEESFMNILSSTTGHLLVGLSGGSTPEPLYVKLGARSSIPWSRLFFFLVDERYVPIDHEHSNTNLVNRTLFKDGLKGASFIYPDCTLPMEACLQDYSDRLRAAADSSTSMVVFLGMGGDGHVASWFPPLEQDQEEDIYKVYHTTTDRFNVRDRITVSLKLLAKADSKLFLMRGDDKVVGWNALMSRSVASTRWKEPMMHVLESGDCWVLASPPLSMETGICHRPLSIVIMGASGDLAKKKTFPALYHLWADGHLPRNLNIIGYARSTQFNIASASDKYHDCSPCNQKRIPTFDYVSGAYDGPDGYERLEKLLNTLERGRGGDRLFYLALPPTVFPTVCDHLRKHVWSKTGWNRVVIEKPFGRDLPSAQALSQQLTSILLEQEMYRIDHYLGKEMTLQMLTLRFANLLLSPLWNRHHIASVRITFKEDIGTQGRGGYFDSSGIIRDVIQNHLLQLLTLTAMERPASLKDDDVRDEKVKVLRQIAPLDPKDVVLGQYTRNGSMEGYKEDATVPNDSKTPTYAVMVLRIANERWDGVPFILKAGKGMEERRGEIRLQLRSVPGLMYEGEVAPNEIVIQLQPTEAVYFKMVAKAPGLEHRLQQTELDLTFGTRFNITRVPEAYERLILDVVKGDKRNFVRSDELIEAWRLFDPLLHALEDTTPFDYVFGSRGPPEGDALIAREGFRRVEGYTWHPRDPQE